MNRIIIKQERVVTIATTTFTMPEWMRLAIEGQKINAIKALREVGGRHGTNDYGNTAGAWCIGLKVAKDIVESVCAGIRITNEQV